MPWDCGLLCLFTDRRRFCEILWRKRLLVTNDEKKAKRRFLNLMRGFDSEDLDVLRRAVESNGRDIKQCAPGPPMDLVEEEDSDVEETLLTGGTDFNANFKPRGCSATIVSTRPRHSINRLERDRILFQRQKYPVSHQIPSCSHSTIPNTQTHTFQRNRRQSSLNYNRPGQLNETPTLPTTALGIIENLDTMSSDGEDEQISSFRQNPYHNNNFTDIDLPLKNLSPYLSPQYEDSGLIPQIDRPMSMPYLCCKMWRWKDLQVDAALHTLDPLPWCRFGRVTINNATVSCCNPFHYGLWIKQEQNVTDVSLLNGGGRLFTDNTRNHQNIKKLSLDTKHEMSQGEGIGHVRTAFSKSVEQIIDEQKMLNDELPLSSPPPVPTSELQSIINPVNNINPSIHSQALGIIFTL